MYSHPCYVTQEAHRRRLGMLSPSERDYVGAAEPLDWRARIEVSDTVHTQSFATGVQHTHVSVTWYRATMALVEKTGQHGGATRKVRVRMLALPEHGARTLPRLPVKTI